MYLAIIGYLMICVLVYLLLKGKTSPIILFIGLPLIAAALLGFSIVEIGQFAAAGVETTMNNAVLFIFSIMYFGLMNDAGMFDGLIDKLVEKAGTKVVSVTIVTAIIGIIGHLDGSAATTALVTIPAMLPIYKKLNIRPTVLLAIIACGMGVMNLVPWGGPTARVATVLEMNANDVWRTVLPIQIAGIIATIGLAYVLGKLEIKRGAGLVEGSSEIEKVAATVDEKVLALKRPKLANINIGVTLVILILLMLNIIPSHVVFMIAFSVAMLINYPNIKDQNARFKAHAPSALSISATMIAAGIFVGVMNETGMLEAMANVLLGFVPEALGQYIHIIMGIVAAPIGIVLGTDAFFYGLLPVAIGVGNNYGVDPLNIAITMLVGKNLAVILSPAVAATFLATGLAGVELKDHIKFTFKWVYGISLIMIVLAIVTGVISL
ncbi:citrate:H+ symporter [Candidatus Epulonipiscium fishelsonii]|uniref:Citrate:H+ symporter n=1 Tax=Candidatus Epulonipiscium fishelsonii TaxID=77094 RepID=A0ACC8XBZ3_9FIRM|nr:citrate:H+ symporter [Epulopiscium sp. SCG-B05WGA-EpuloA1]ONI40041.1 citrate:H+ symporter [Epulopiscium sp. SCG-B11WGA-EpuloA1]